MPVFKFAKIVDTKTPHRVGAPAAEVFGKDAERLAKVFMPLVTVRLVDLHPEWDGEAHVLYHGMNRAGGVSFKMETDAGRTTLVYLGDVEGSDEVGLDRRRTKQGYLKLVDCDVPLAVAAKETTGSFVPRTQPDTDKLYDLFAGLADPELLWMSWFGVGSRPYWSAHRDDTPTCPETKRPMTFLGQARADHFSDEVADL